MQLNEILSEKVKKYCFNKPEWEKMEFVNHGLGLIRKEEHDELIKIGAIICEKGVDSVLANYPKLVIIKNGEDVPVEMFGNMKEILKEKQDNERKGIKCKVVFTPKKYQEYYDNKRSLRLAEEYENEAIEELVKEHF